MTEEILFLSFYYLLGVNFMPETDQYLIFFFLAHLSPEQFNEAVVVSLFSRLGRAFVTAALSAHSSPLNQCPPPLSPSGC